MSVRTALAVLVTMMLAAGAAAQPAPTTAFSFSRSDYAADKGARAVVTADFDNDGAPDFATANAGSNTVDVFMNREFAGGGFTVRRYTVGAGPFDLATADLNFDGYPELIVAAADANEIDVLFGAAGGNLQPAKRIPVSGNPRGVAVGYFGFDGSYGYSIIYSSYASGTISFLDYDYNSGDFNPGITLNAGTNPQGIVLGYFKPTFGGQDIAVANAGGSPITLFLNNGGIFTRTQLAAPSGFGGTHMNLLVTADFDRDGKQDLAAASTSDNDVAVYLNSSTGLHWTHHFTGSMVSSPRGLLAADLNVDGRPELIVANRGSSSVTVFIANASAALFPTYQVVASASGSRAVAAEDFDGDGRVDLATANEYVSAGSVLWNRTVTGGGTGATAFLQRALPEVNPDCFWTNGAPFAAADFNHNGIPDLVVGDGVVLDAKTAVKVDAGRKSPYTAGAITGDFNEDGHQDFAQLIWYDDLKEPFHLALALDFMIGDGAGHFTLGTSLPFSSLRGYASGDVNRDGHVDVIVLDDTGSGLVRKVFLGRGDGTFVEHDQATTTNDYLTGIGDVNGDGKLDLVVWNYDYGQMVVYQGDGAGNFPSQHFAPSVGLTVYSSRVADVNGDGRADIVALRNGTTLVTWLGRSDGNLSAPITSDLPESSYGLVIADLTGDGRPDVLTSEGTLAVGKGDGSFGMNRNINISFTQAVVADIDRDGLPDVFIGTYNYTAMALYNLTSEPPNAAPVASMWPHDLTLNFVSQFDEEGFRIESSKSYDPNIDPLSFTWFESERVIGNDQTLYLNMAPGKHVVTLVVRDNAGAESRDSATMTITPYEEIVMHAVEMAGRYGAWVLGSDPTGAGGVVWHPNANAAKLAAPLANPNNYIEMWFPADPTQEYKLWIRMKAQNNSGVNDSVFVQFEGAVDGAGAPVYQIGTTSGLAVNLEECTGCGLSGWGWRDEAWGAKGATGAVTLRFPAGKFGMGHRIRIQTREDGVMVDQVVLSATKYKTARPGAVKNDATILMMTVPWD